ncbi:MAG: pyridoxal kinase PdxY [Alphaproteobacteria bacterium]|nr:pyridoxal kinase PdxY [Alphaproteobacteria bacterium]
MRNVLSIQSWVAYGHVGNASAVFPMQRLGVEVWAINTVMFSNHTGYGKWRGPVFPADQVREVFEGIADRGVLGTCDGIVSGYMGDAAIGEAILDAAARVKAANPQALYCCDPVIGDVGRGVFVRPGIPEFMRDRAVPAADIVTPNQFELEYLSGMTVKTLADACKAADAVHKLGPKTILLTSLHHDGLAADKIAMMVSHHGKRFAVETPMLKVSVNGAGDAIAALFFVHFGRTRDPKLALENATASIYGLLKRTEEAGTREIQTVAAQQEFVEPTWRFAAVEV